jgi:hypothetical protein
MTTQLEKEIVSMLERGSVSFAELSQIDGFNGSLVYGALDRNILVWMDMSPEAIEILERLRKQGRYRLGPTTPLVYFIDGRVPQLPVVKNAQHTYKKYHWLPSVWNKVDGKNNGGPRDVPQHHQSRRLVLSRRQLE